MKSISHKILLITIFLVSFHSKNFSQDNKEIQEIHIYAFGKSFFDNSRKIKIDSSQIELYSNFDISEILKITSPVIIKTYGSSGSLSTISLRGTGANQTAVLWNGFPINSLTTGGADLSQISTVFFNDIEIIPGASGSLFGSGTFGGVINLKNNFSKENFSSKINFEVGNYKNLSEDINMKYSSKKISFDLSFINSSGLNNFIYTDYYKIDKPKDRRDNNNYFSQGLLENFKIKLRKNYTIENGIWLQRKSKEIPEPAGSYGIGNKLQNDSSLKTYIRINKLSKNYRISFGTAYIYDFLHYTDKTSSDDTLYIIDSEIIGRKLLNDFSLRKYINKNLIIDIGTSYKYLYAQTTSFKKYENNGNTYISSKIRMGSFDLTGNISLELNENIKPKAIYNAGFTYSNRKSIIKANLSKNFRKPSFNERYWTPGGNPNLLFESGISSDLGIEIELLKTLKKTFSISSNNYFSQINNMIQWVPKDGFWQAVNNKKVISYGNETSANLKINKNEFVILIDLSYQYTKSFNTDFYNSNTDNIGTQLIYIPYHTAKEYFSINYKKLSLSVSSYYTGKRFTTEDNNENYIIKPYLIENIFLAYKTRFDNFNIETVFKINNILNTDYESIKSFPMPGRMYFFNIGIGYKKKEND